MFPLPYPGTAPKTGIRPTARTFKAQRDCRPIQSPRQALPHTRRSSPLRVRGLRCARSLPRPSWPAHLRRLSCPGLDGPLSSSGLRALKIEYSDGLSQQPHLPAAGSKLEPSKCLRAEGFVDLNRFRLRPISDKAEDRGSEIFTVEFERQPAATSGFCSSTRRVRACEEVQHHVAWLGEKVDEEGRQLLGEPSRMTRDSSRLAQAKICRVALGIRKLQEVRWDRTTVRVSKALANIVAGRPLFGRVEAFSVFKEFPHPGGVRTQ